MLPLLSESKAENSLLGTLITNFLCTDVDEGLNGATTIQLSGVFQITFVNVTDLLLFGDNDSTAKVFVLGD